MAEMLERKQRRDCPTIVLWMVKFRLRHRNVFSSGGADKIFPDRLKRYGHDIGHARYKRRPNPPIRQAVLVLKRSYEVWMLDFQPPSHGRHISNLHLAIFVRLARIGKVRQW